ncbi:type II toxin-antitoxin system PemK/MazF family toxin [Desulfobacterota bacterium AH_259_B03_O07]|nr:type II toxin-antitoxin system PemK/MazF family toxin [Desulfobacterota bacterium AH_259_B03_O07]
MKIKKWHVYMADLNPRMGTEPGKARPVIVVQTDLLNGIHPSTVICPLTTKVEPKSRYLRVHLAEREAGLKKKSDIMVDQIRAIDNRRFLTKQGELSRKNQAKLSENLRILLT